ncbi:hypothetical protein VPH35_123082 [Triticum aestivum]
MEAASASRARPVRVMGAHWTHRARRDRRHLYEHAVDVGRRRMSPLCSSSWSSSATSFQRLSLAAAMADAEAARGERLVQSGSSGASDARGTCGTHWCGRARQARRVRAGRAGRRGTSGVCRWRRRSSAYVVGVVTEHGATGVDATGVDAPDRVRRLGHNHDRIMTGAAATPTKASQD